MCRRCYVGVTQVTMGIDERRHHRLALKVDDGAARRPLHRAACADLRDSRPFDHEGGVLQSQGVRRL